MISTTEPLPLGVVLGRTLRARRRAAHLTQAELAQRAQLSARTVQNLEAGRVARPRAATLRLLTAALPPLDTRAPLPRAWTERTQRSDRARPAAGAARPYADRVTTEPTAATTAAQPRADGTAGVPPVVLPDAYAFPADRLASGPTIDAAPLLWLEPDDDAVVVGPDGTTTEARFRICRAFAVQLTSAPRWVIDVLARAVRPLDAVEVVNALRAFRPGGEEADS